MAVMRKTVLATAAVLAVGVAVALPAHATTADQPQGFITNADAPGTIDDSYIVILEDSTFSAASAAAENLADKYDAEIVTTYEHALNGYEIAATEAEALALAADPAVKEVVQNQVFTIDATQTNPPSWGLDRIDQPALPLDQSYTYPDSAGAGTTVYVIDTGIRTTHQDFGGRASFGYDYWGGTANDGNGHGTHVASTAAGTAYGVAKNADIVAVKVLNDAGSGTTASVVGGIDWVTGNASGPSVANVSLGGGADTTLDQAVRNSIAAGVTYAIAAGNSNANAANYSPARVSEAITVGATQSNDSRASYSNWGATVDIFAPGTSITAAWHTSDTATNTISGTSMATPHVAGVAALYLADNPGATPAQTWSALDSAAATGQVTNPGSGSPDKLLQVP
ncbi:Peptidase inhibitor I9 [Streptomyces harbinensis]|uniref:Peptidase inhibitor I9 n=2 Tax=Streptomyces harbinensis TaxID=1176198 RepID=A0A1I6P8F4_9ACTN|nr:Peptidase inhibitor I9 [Streptomyces harbinensis]